MEWSDEDDANNIPINAQNMNEKTLLQMMYQTEDEVAKIL